MTNDAPALPESWVTVALQDIAELNPKFDKAQIADDANTTFVPMSAVQAETGRMDVSRLRPFAEVKKGFTSFRERDILFAKITPCMENG